QGEEEGRLPLLLHELLQRAPPGDAGLPDSALTRESRPWGASPPPTPPRRCLLRKSLETVNRFLDAPLDVAPRLLLALAFLCLVPAYVTPLYNMTMFAPQYQDGLR